MQGKKFALKIKLKVAERFKFFFVPGGGGTRHYGPYEEAPPQGGRYLDLFHAGFKYMKG